MGLRITSPIARWWNSILGGRHKNWDNKFTYQGTRHVRALFQKILALWSSAVSTCKDSACTLRSLERISQLFDMCWIKVYPSSCSYDELIGLTENWTPKCVLSCCVLGLVTVSELFLCWLQPCETYKCKYHWPPERPLEMSHSSCKNWGTRQGY